MQRRRSTAAVIGMALLAGAIVPATVHGDGLPVGGLDVGATGVARAGGQDRVVTLPAGRDTVVARVRRDGGRVVASRRLAGSFTIPAVAYDGSADGLSADGRRLVLIRPRRSFPQAGTTLAVLAADRLRLLRVVRLRGDFSFDAISPDGSLMYLVHYTSRRDYTRYEVRAYDLDAGRLLPFPIVDPREPDEQMGGLPMARVGTPDGRWQYTLYEGGGSHPFVHALDTVGLTAACIDLELPAFKRGMAEPRLDLRSDGRLAVLDGTRPLALVDRTSFRVSAPPVALVRERAPTEQRDGPPWPLLGWAVLLTLAAGTAALVRRRHAAAAGEPDDDAELEAPARVLVP